MYESFFGLSERPFAAAPSAKHYFPAAAIEAARQTLVRCVERAEGGSLLIGPAGSGKSLLCHVLAEQFRDRFSVALLESGRVCTRRALLQAILFELGLPYRNLEEGDLRLSLVDHLSPRGQAAEAATSLLLIVDEADSLPLRLLEELRLLSNLVCQGQPRVRLVLAGGPQFEERLASPKLESFNQRIAARCYLEPLDRSQTIDYVRHQIREAGGSPERVFTTEALGAVHQATDGIPRLINQVCDHALLLACAGGVRQLTAGGIEEAWADLQQLPTPWNAGPGAPSREAAPGVIEFGELDDEFSDDLPPAVPFRSAISGEATPHLALELDAGRSQIEISDASEEEFEPAGTIRPEVELHFQRTANPFHEAFDEEEVVRDPYTTARADDLAERRTAYGEEALEIASLQAPMAADSDVGSSQGMPWHGGLPTEQHKEPAPAEGEMLESEAGETNQAADAGSVAEEDETDIWRHVPEIEESDATWLPSEAAGQPPRSPTAEGQPKSPPKLPKLSPPIPVTRLPPSLGASSDEDMIVVDDLPRQPAPAVPKEPPPKRRHEFRQLFAKLRRE